VLNIRKAVSILAEFNITCGRRPFSVDFIRTADRNTTCSVSVLVCTAYSFRGGSASLVGMKRRHDTQSKAGNAKKRVTHDTFLKWKRDLDRECQTMTWLDCETGMESGKKIVEKLKCKVCTEFVDKIHGRKHFSDKWICGADSIRTSNVRDHFHNDQHSHAMSLLKKKQRPLDWV